LSQSFKRAQDEATKELVGQVNEKFTRISTNFRFDLDRFNDIQFENL